MASDSQDPSRRKHRRSSDDESEEPSKRRKHRHHHRHHRHRSRKHGEDEAKHDEHGTNLDRGEDSILQPPLPPIAIESGSNWRPDYDMEEGEIVEEDEGFVESTDIRAVKVRSELDNCNMEVLESQNGFGLNSSINLKDNLDRNRDLKASGNKSGDGFVSNAIPVSKEGLSARYKIHDGAVEGKNLNVENHANGGFEFERSKKDKQSNSGSGSPTKVIQKRKSHYDGESDTRGQKKPLSVENTGDKHKISSRSRSRDRFNEEYHGVDRSHDQTRERARSQSILQETSLKNTHQVDAAYHMHNRKTRNDSDDDVMAERYRDHRHGSRDLLRDKERERSSSRNRYTGRVERHHSRETRERERLGSRETLDRDREGREMENDRKGEREQDRDRERERERERDRGRGRERERERERDRERERERDRVRERERGRGRGRGRGREREREGERDRNRDNDREKESDRSGRHHRYDNVSDDYGDQNRYRDFRGRRHDGADHRDRTRKKDPESTDSTKNAADKEKLKRDEDELEDYQESIALKLADQEDEDLNRIEESRRRRQAILEKYKTQQLQQQSEPQSDDIYKENLKQPFNPVAGVNVASDTVDGQNEGADIFADSSFSVGKSPPQNGRSVVERTSGAGGLGEGTPKSERSEDMFCDDIFGESPAGVRKPGKGDILAIERSGLNDNWDDAEGYYSYRFGEILDGRYEVIAAHGKGVFSTVVRAKDLKAGAGDPEEVAIKIIRNNDTMYKAGLEELVILKKLVGADPENRRHCVRFLSSFKYRNHLCLVFESLHMNLREVLKKFGRNIGLKLTAVRAYAKQLFIALKHLRNCGVLHSDIKPDNMLVNEAKNVLKLCDFGNAMFAGKNEITPYLVSRFYRAPEIILGLPYDHPMDIWSVGCCLFELSTGRVLFPGATNNDMLRLHMELKGPFPKKMLRKGAFTDLHFDQDLNFLATEDDPVTKKTIKRLILNIKQKDVGTIVMSSPGEDPKMLANFKDLLEKIFVLDPDKRITVSQALSHPFITGK